ncbi:MAG: amidohydrolase [Clostridia bacterium]|nr:amidohydrolase [Clostridia bacterium]
MKILFKNANILDFEQQNGFLFGNVVVQNDTIVYVGKDIPNDTYDQTIDVKGNVLMPGFVDTHCHSPMTILRGLKDDANLNEWLFDNMIPCEAKLTPNDIYWGQKLAILEYVKAGITCIEEGYFYNEEIVKAIKETGIRARVGFGPTTRDVGMTNMQYLEYQNNIIGSSNLIKPVCFIHSIYTTEENIICECVDYTAKNNIPLSIHLAETLKEVGDCTVKNNNKTPAQYLEDLGFFDRPNAMCYHCVHMDKDDLQILADYDVNVSTCPSSNIKLASGIAPVYAMQNKGINITIGTDGVASNNSLDMFKEMFLVATLSKVNIYDASVVTAKDVLKMATINGANALGFNVGEIKVGKNADIILINIDQPHYYPHHNLLSHLVYAGKSGDVYLTMVNGKILYNNGEFYIGKDAQTIYRNVTNIRERITK